MDNFLFNIYVKLHYLTPKPSQQDNLELSCQMASSYCQKSSSGHSKTILLCLTESTSTAMTIDCPTELHCQDNHIVWPSVLCQDNIFVLPKEMTSAKTILDCLAEWFLPRQRIVLPKFLMVDKTIWLSWQMSSSSVRQRYCLGKEHSVRQSQNIVLADVSGTQ